MSRHFVSLLVLEGVLSLAALPQTSTAIAYDYATLAFPHAMSTSANGINNNNVIVGSYVDSASFEHGFIYKAGKYTKIDFPGASATAVLGINDNNDLVGVYQLPGPLNFHGFLRQNGDFYKIDAPRATFGTVAAGINNAGTIVGTYDDTHGFIYRSGTYKTWNAPRLPGESTQTQLNGISNHGWIVGQVFSGGNWRGFWFNESDLDFLEPVFSNDNEVTGMNGRSDIVGCHDAAAGFVSFNVEAAEGSEKTERFPIRHPLSSCASSINFARVIVGNYFTTARPNGFLAVPALNLSVANPAPHASLTNPVHLSATAWGIRSVSQIQVWVNSKKVLQVNGGTLSATVWLPIGQNERVGIQAIDTNGMVARVVQTVAIQ
jgi:uncharacterized membrane protein